MLNKKLFTIFLILLIIILIIFAILYFLQQNKVPDEKTKPTAQSIEKQEDKKIVKPQEIFPIKEVILSTDKQVYNPNEEIKAVGIIKNPFPKIKKWTIVYYFMSEDEKSFAALGQTKELELKPGQTEKIEFISVVSQNLPPGNYKIKLEVLEQKQKICLKSKIIKIQGTNKQLNARMQICEDENCRIEKLVYLLEDNIYLKINFEVSGLNIKASIKYPNQNESQNLDFKNNLAIITANQIGSYEVIINIKKDGYSEIFLKKDFAVIETSPNF